MTSVLNKAQREAVEYNDGPLLIVAGAGTGKTTVITQKIAYLVENKLATPNQILALTFTDKAANEMMDRMDALLNTSYVDMQVSTFHAFCRVLLERYDLDIGLSTQFKSLTETDAWLLIRQNLRKFNLDYYRPLGNPTRHIHELIKHFSKCKDELISPQEYLDYAKELKLDKGDANVDEKTRLSEIANAYHVYNQLLLENNALDFSDLIFYTVKLLETRPNILRALQEHFKYILVDEFQDVNWSQYKLVQMLAGKDSRLTVVGDDDQSIYAFRGASVSNIMRFKDDYKNTREVVLKENYRSGQEILDVAYQSIINNNPDRLEVKLKIDKKLVSKAKQKSFVKYLPAETGDDEAIMVAKEIQEIKAKDETATWDDFAILCRANNHAEPFLHALEAADIPYEFMASSGLFRQPLILDCINYFKLLDNYHEHSAVYRLMRLPFLEFDETDMQKFTAGARKKTINYYDMLKCAKQFGVSADGVKKCTAIRELSDEGMKKAKQELPTAVLYFFLEKSGYFAYLTRGETRGDREIIRQIYHLKQFFDYLKKYEQSVPGAHISDFMEHYAQIREAGDDGKIYQVKDTPDSVNVMTVHSSKGMEFKYVFVVNMVEQRFPARSRGDAIEVPIPLIKEQLPEGDIHYQEERRLFYVAATRAKNRLYFTSAEDYGGAQARKISRFLAEIDLAPPEKNKAEKRALIEKKEERRKKNKAEKGEFVYELPKTFSFSQIKSYNTCPYQYKLANILKIPQKSNATFSFGTTMHNTLYKFYEQVQEMNAMKQDSLFGGVIVEKKGKGIKVPPLETLLELYEQTWIPDWFTDKTQREEYYKKGLKVLKDFYKANDGQWTVPVVLEKGFKIKIGSYILSGRLDRVDQLADGTLELIDYKTGKVKEKVSGDDKDQLLLYQMVTQTMPEYVHLGKTGKLTYYYLEHGVRTDFIGKPADLEKLQEKIIETVDQIQKKDFPATPSKFICDHCEYKDICEFRE